MASETPPLNKTLLTTSQWYRGVDDDSLWEYRGSVLGWIRIGRYSDLADKLNVGANETLSGPGDGVVVADEDGVPRSVSLISTSLVSPTITPAWTLFKTDGTTPYSPSTSASKSLSVDKGVRANGSHVYQYPSPGAGQGAPTGVTGSWGTTLPAPATPSSPLIVTDVTTNSSYSVTLSKLKDGLPVVNGYVTLPTGNDTTQDSMSITFRGRFYLINSSDANLSGASISSLISGLPAGFNKLQTGIVATFNSVTSGAGNYTYLIHEVAEGTITNVIQNGALPVFTAFSYLADVSVINPGGLSVSMKRFRTNLTEAFTNVTLTVS